MATKNVKRTDGRIMKTKRLAGGMGQLAAKQSDEAALRRIVMTCLLWEDAAYIKGADVVKNISKLVPRIDPAVVRDIAIEAKFDQKLRHVPLYIAVEMVKHDKSRPYVADLLHAIITRPDDITEVLALYYDGKKKPLANQIKKGIARAFGKFDEYQLAKWNREGKTFTLKDAAFLTHPSPDTIQESIVEENPVNRKGYKRGQVSRHSSYLVTKLIEDRLETPDTWEVALSAGKDKKATWERLIMDKKIGATAFLKNLRNMQDAKVSEDALLFGFENLNTRWLLPLDYFKAAKYAPKYVQDIEKMMLRSLAVKDKLPGRTIFIVDVSGSMNAVVSANSNFRRLDVASAMAVMANEMCERCYIWATAGYDGRYQHRTELVPSYRGFALAKQLSYDMYNSLGGGGIFTRQCLEHIRKETTEDIDRIIIFSDSQDCDRYNMRTPAPFAKYNYIVDVSPHRYGVNYDGIWTAEVSGWSEHFLKFIYALEGYDEQNQM